MSGHIPENDRSIHASGDQDFAVGRKSQAAHLAFVTFERRSALLTSGNIPQNDITEFAAGSEQTTVGTKCNVR